MVKSPPMLFTRKRWTKLDTNNASYILLLHLLCILAPFYFTWTCFFLAMILGNLTGMAISVSYHRNLTHRAFKLPKWLEYSLAYCAAHTIQVQHCQPVRHILFILCFVTICFFLG